MPPDTLSVSAVMKDASSDARNPTAAATSSGWPSRPTIVPSMSGSIARSPASRRSRSMSSVWMGPGAIALTVMLKRAFSRAMDFVNPRTAAFDAQ